MLNNKNIVITGGLQGIGRETIGVFARNGANVFACSYIKDQSFEEWCKNLEEENNVTIQPVYFDMNDMNAVKDAAKVIQQSKREIHGLVNVAGINRDALFGMIKMQDIMETFQVNVFSQIIFTQYIVRIMQRNKTKGSIVFTSSVTAMDGNRGQTVYGASKAALLGAMKSMAMELGSDGIRVNAVAPGVIKTPMTDSLSQEEINKKIRTMDIPHLGAINDVANLYLFLITDMSSHITGQVLRVDGGIR